MSDDEKSFWTERPKPSKLEREITNVFWSLRRECDGMNVIKSKDIEDALESVEIEVDLGVRIIKTVDDYYRHLYAEEMRRKKK